MVSKLGATVAPSLAIGLIAATTATAAPGQAPPRWVTHVKKYPGGISNGVRASLDSGVSSARPGLGPTSPMSPSLAAPNLDNRQVNSQDSNPAVPQNETQV